MPIVVGAGLSYSPLLYRERARWGALGAHLRGDAIQPKAAADEDDAVLDDYAGRVAQGLAALERVLASQDLDALILLSADRGTQFDDSHIPQIHLQVGGEVWGNPAIEALGEAPRQLGFTCEVPVAELLIEELVRDGFDVTEARRGFKPVGDPERGMAAAAAEAADRLAAGVPLIPISINCHVPPILNGRRLHRFGTALGRLAAMTDKRIGLLVSGGLSGDPLGPMSGWVDDVFDRWALTRIERGRSLDLARVWDAASRTLIGSTAEVRLWMVAAAALEQAGCRARVHDYMPNHHAATGVAFVSWEN